MQPSPGTHYRNKKEKQLEINSESVFRSLQVYGNDISFQQAGNGPPLLFVHGGASDSRTWNPQLNALSDEFTIIAWGEPGAGRSSDVPDHFELNDYADCLAGFITQLEIMAKTDLNHVLPGIAVPMN